MVLHIAKENILKRLEEIYGAPESVSIKVMKEQLKAWKELMMSEKPIRFIELFHRLNYRLMKPAEQEATTWILPSRPPIQKQQDIKVHPNLHTIWYHGFKGYRVLEWQTCNKVWKESGDIRTHILHPKM